MMSSIRLNAMRLIPFALGYAIVLTLITTIHSQNGTKPEALREVEPPRAKPNWGELISFSTFRKIFNKRYSTLLEDVRRHKVYVKNSLLVSASRLRYLLGWIGSYLSLNSRSDWTKDEWHSSLMFARDYRKNGLAFTEGLDTSGGSARRKTTDGQARNAPQKTRVEVTSGSDDVKYNKKGLISHLKDYYYSRSYILQNALSMWKLKTALNLPPRDTSIPDGVSVDHRQFDCLSPVKDQHNCGSCTYFATTALFEWAYCRLTGDKIRFSEQYAIECAAMIGQGGCWGDHELEVSQFHQEFGFELEEKYANTLEQEKQCAYPWVKGNMKKMGQYHMDKTQLISIPFEDIETQLAFSPVLVPLLVGDNFFDYGGGVDNAAGCEKSEYLHLMLIVGSGRQNGYEYWIMRNSYGKSWGESGYYRLRKNNLCYGSDGYGSTLEIFVENQDEEIKSNLSKPLRDLKNLRSSMYNFTENPEHDDKYLEGRGENSLLEKMKEKI